mgnify:CR=1 FL=1
MMAFDWVYQATTWVLPVLLAVTLHEAAHGYVALAFGDDTAKRKGRLTLNPIRHVDPFGTILLPAILLVISPVVFGYAKPVPVDFRNLNQPKRDMIWVAVAGPGTNIALAVLAALLTHVAVTLPDGAAQWVMLNLRNAVLINLVLAALNMLPIPPLDGSRVVTGILPEPLASKYASLEKYGLLVLLGLLFLLPLIGAQIGIDLGIIFWVLGAMVEWLFGLIAPLAYQGTPPA